MADPVYDDEGIDLITLTFAVLLAAALAFLLSHLVPQLVDLMTIPPPLSGEHAWAIPGEIIIAPTARAEMTAGRLDGHRQGASGGGRGA